MIAEQIQFLQLRFYDDLLNITLRAKQLKCIQRLQRKSQSGSIMY